MSALTSRIQRNDSVILEIDDSVFLTRLRGDQVVRVAKDVYEADGITFDFTRERASWDDEGRRFNMPIGPLDADDLKAWFEKHADKANMEIVKPKLEEKMNPDVAKEIAKYGGKKKRTRKSKRQTRKKTFGARKD